MSQYGIIPICTAQYIVPDAVKNTAFFSLRRHPSEVAGAGSRVHGQYAGRDPDLKCGRAAVDAATRNTLDCVSSGNTLLTCLPGEEKAKIRLWTKS